MDMFTDKLAQKLTAQEMIRANTAADLEELNRLKNQAAEYEECLGKLQELIDGGFERLSGIKEEEEGVLARLVAENSGGAEALRRDVADLKASLGQLQGRLEGIGRAVADQKEAAGSSGERVGALQEQLAEAAGLLVDRTGILQGQMDEVEASLGERIDQLCGQLEAQSTGGLSERLIAVEESVHRECVKVYRNVQAVVVEESRKQGELLEGVKSDLVSAQRKSERARGFAIAAAVLSGLCAAGVLFQILVLSGIVSI